MLPFSVFLSSFSGAQRILGYVRPRTIVLVHPPKKGGKEEHLEEPSDWDSLCVASWHNWPSKCSSETLNWDTATESKREISSLNISGVAIRRSWFRCGSPDSRPLCLKTGAHKITTNHKQSWRSGQYIRVSPTYTLIMLTGGPNVC